MSGMKPYHFCHALFDGTGYNVALDSPNVLKLQRSQEYGKPVGRNTGYDKDQTMESNPKRMPDGAGICPRFFVGYTWLHASD